MNPAQSDYQRQDSTLTLREGLEAYFAENPQLLDPDTIEGKAAELFRCHDAVHVVFGTNTEIRQEAMTDTWSMFGTDIPWREFIAYLNEPAAIGVVNDIGWGTALWESVKAVPAVIEVVRRGRRMTKKWPWYGHEAYLDVPLASIREEFGIEVFQPRPASEAAPAMP